MSKPSRAKPCVYCGNSAGTTKDHVIPRCLFETLPQQMVTVRVCRRCNEKKAALDPYLRDYLAFDRYGASHPDARSLFLNKVIKAGSRKQSEFVLDAMETVRLEPLYTPNGLYLGQTPTANIDGDKLEEELSLIVRGLFAYYTKSVLPFDCKVSVGRVNHFQHDDIVRGMQEFGFQGPFKVGNAFSCVFARAEEVPNYSIWLMEFFDTVLFGGETTPAGFKLDDYME